MGSADLVLLFGLAALAANLPFWGGRRRFFGLRCFSGDKGFGWILLEWLLAWGLWMGLALLLEKRMQPIHPQNWQFWVVSLCLFLILAFPGFTARYLWPQHGHEGARRREPSQ